MYPNPQEALPLTARPSVEYYRKLAKDLVKACRSGEATAIRAWASRWINRLATLHAGLKTLQTADEMDAAAGSVAIFARQQFNGRRCSLTTAHFVADSTVPVDTRQIGVLS